MRKHFKCISSIALSLALVTTSVFAGANLGTKNVAKASSLSTMTSADVETPDNPQIYGFKQRPDDRSNGYRLEPW